MVLTRTKVVGIALAGIIALGGTTAFAATNYSLTEVKGVNLEEIAANSPMVDAKDLKVTGEIPQTGKDQLAGKTTDPAEKGQSSISLTKVKGVNLEEIAADSPMVDVKVKVAGEIPQTVKDQLASKTTSAR
ncbi:hypothetical protein [Cohnella rhizosphaerae]|uniref:Secreted protein n=1 Tax=Cohnella rhizosphaerae TaxID=1457232 RepID=A0A9X4KSG7_9BACL|nr:hypothetical protein [Cohnella rhizosphaerae]MDG0810349.1 hypothetical protein [Cohnella rhizosphaerae]